MRPKSPRAPAPSRRSPRPIRFAVVGPHRLTRDLLRTTLSAAGGQFAFVVEVEHGQAERMAKAVIDLMLVDLCGARGREYAEFHELIRTGNPWAVLAVTAPEVTAALGPNSRGAGIGFISRESSLDTMVHAASVVAAGGVYFDAQHAGVLALQNGGSPLTTRETDVLRLVAEGCSSKEVSSILELSVKTVEKYRTSLMQKIGVHDVVRLTHYAIRLGLVNI